MGTAYGQNTLPTDIVEEIQKIKTADLIIFQVGTTIYWCLKYRMYSIGHFFMLSLQQLESRRQAECAAVPLPTVRKGYNVFRGAPKISLYQCCHDITQIYVHTLHGINCNNLKLYLNLKITKQIVLSLWSMSGSTKQVAWNRGWWVT